MRQNPRNGIWSARHRGVRKESSAGRLQNPEKLNVEDLGIAPSPATSHSITGDTLSNNRQDTSGNAVATVLPADIENAEALNFDETDIIALFKKPNNKAGLCVTIMSKILRPAITVFDTGAVPNLVQTSHLLPEWCRRVKPLQISLKSSSADCVAVARKILLFVQLCDLQIRVHFGSKDSPAVLLLISTSFFDGLV